MSATTYDWARTRAFLAIVIPRYVNINGVIAWDIYYEITSWKFVRENKVPTKLWYEL